MEFNSASLLKHQAELETIIKRLRMIRVSSGFFELICPQDSIIAFIDEMDRLDIKILRLRDFHGGAM